MSNIEPLNPGQEVFLRRPLEIYATVIGTPEGDSRLPGDQVRYAVRLLPLEQIYLPEDLELSSRAQPNNSWLDYASGESAKQRSDFNEAVTNLAADDSFLELAQETNGMIARRAYELYEFRGFTHGHDTEDWMRAVSEILLNIPADISETDTQLTIRADVPGVSAEDLEVRVASRSLCIAGKRKMPSKQTTEKPVYSERRSHRIFRVLDLPCEIYPYEVTASVSGGVLEVRLLKVDLRNVVPFHARAAIA